MMVGAWFTMNGILRPKPRFRALLLFVLLFMSALLHRDQRWTFPHKVSTTSAPPTNAANNHHPLLPVQALRAYQRLHSVDAIRRNPHGRAYAVAHYACPYQAGNRLHHFMNDLLLAMATNRTLLYKYWDQDSCRQLGNKYDQEFCVHEPSDCEGILEPRQWMASFDDFAPNAELIEVFDGGMTQRRIDHNITRVSWHDGERHGPLDAWPLVVFRPKVGAQTVASIEKLFPDRDGAIWTDLFALGPNFLYGLLFHETFHVLTDVEGPQALEKGVSIAVHSRHIDPDDDGSDISSEIRCLEQVLPTEGPCQVFVLSDRRSTLTQLRRWIRGRGCAIGEAEHAKTKSFETEHGPFAGVGFFQDLLVASRARSGYVGHSRSSSKLLYEWIEYRRGLELWEDGQDPRLLSSLSRCILQD